jgi:haloalkane dehalogenase
LDVARYPFTSHFVEVDGGLMHYVDEGEGPPIVLVHGNPTWSFLYRRLVVDLARDHRCVAPDHLGFGLSDLPPEDARLPVAHAARFAALMGSLELGAPPVTLVVHDWGGPIALSWALDHPELVSRVVVLNSWLWPLNSERYYRVLGGLVASPLGRLLFTRTQFFARLVVPAWFGDRSRLTQAVHRHYLAPMEERARRHVAWVLAREVLGSAAWLEELWARRDALARLPLLFVWGMQDLAFREEELRTWLRAFPRAEALRLGWAGHFVPEEAPDALARAVRDFAGGSATDCTDKRATHPFHPFHR